MGKDRGPEPVCLAEDTSKTTEVGPAWLRATGQRGLAQAAQEAEHFLPAQGSQLWDRARGGNLRAQRLCLGAAGNWTSDKALNRQKVCPPEGPSGTLLLSAFWLVSQTRLASFLPQGAAGHLRSIPLIGREGALSLQICRPGRRGCSPAELRGSQGGLRCS